MSNIIRNGARILRNPTVQRVLAMLAPIVLGWILEKLNKKSPSSRKK